ncbi:hypothetical protein KJ840_00210 [Patescibacteria group bacterium]|nr:hypothetical protein [Patescibacteria group bacterium]
MPKIPAQIMEGATRAGGELGLRFLAEGARTIFSTAAEEMAKRIAADLVSVKGPYDNAAQQVILHFYLEHVTNPETQQRQNYHDAFMELSGQLTMAERNDFFLALIAELVITATVEEAGGQAKQQQQGKKKGAKAITDQKARTPVDEIKSFLIGINMTDPKNFEIVCSTIDALVEEYIKLKAKNLPAHEFETELRKMLDQRRLIGDAAVKLFWRDLKRRVRYIPADLKNLWDDVLKPKTRQLLRKLEQLDASMAAEADKVLVKQEAALQKHKKQRLENQKRRLKSMIASNERAGRNTAKLEQQLAELGA